MPIRLGRLTGRAIFISIINHLVGRNGRRLAARDGRTLARR